MPSRNIKRHKRKAARRHRMRLDETDFFLMRTTYGYLQRHLKVFPHLGLDEDFFDLFTTGSSADINDLLRRAMDLFDGDRQKEYEALISECLEINTIYKEIVPSILDRAPKPLGKALRKALLEILEDRIDALSSEGQSDLETNLQAIKKMFNLNRHELSFCVFLYACYGERKLENYFVNELGCNRLNGRKYLGNILGITRNQLNQVLSGTLRKIHFFEIDSDSLSLNQDFLFLFEDPMSTTITEKFFTRVTRSTIPLEYHHGVQDDLDHVMGLLKRKTQTPTHILVYGPPGTGKSSFASGFAMELGIDSYLIAKDDENRSKNRRASIFACFNMTNGGSGSLIIIDEADNVLNTQMSWFYRGETQDKGWLNYLLEQPGARMIWITNDIDRIENSVLRRFAYSIHFKPFNNRQRFLLWKNVLESNKADRYFDHSDIEELARKYKVSAGVIDLAVKKAIETRSRSKKKIQEAVAKGLIAHQTLINDGQKPIDKDRIEASYSLDGLNIKGNIRLVLERLERFNDYLRDNGNRQTTNFNCLFHGPPGTGKTELARYIANRLDRELITKRVSDLQSMWVGESEKNIRRAFEEAQREEAVLVIDEADSLLFPRDRAVRSYETSLTNEFLTQMESYSGILICTTNRLKDLDGASIRRFQEKLEFDYLNPDGNLVFFRKFFKDLIPGDLKPIDQAKLAGISNLAPGDFKIVRDRYIFSQDRNLTHDQLIQALMREAGIKEQFFNTKPIGF